MTLIINGIERYPVDQDVASTITILENHDATNWTEYFESIPSGTSGTLSLYTGYSVLLNKWEGGVDAVVSGITGGVPDGTAVLDALGEVVTTTLDSGGAWVFSSEPASFPVAIVYAARYVEDHSDLQPINDRTDHDAIANDTNNEANRTFAATVPFHTASIGGNCTLIPTAFATGYPEQSWLLTLTGAADITLSTATYTYKARTTQTLTGLQSGKTYPVELAWYGGTVVHVSVGAGVAV